MKLKKRRHHSSYPKAALATRILHHPAARTLGSEPGRDWWLLRFDGGVTGNGRADARGRWAFRLMIPGRRLLAAKAGPATGDPVTVNTCEWQGVASGLAHFAALDDFTPAPGLLIEGDSDLVVCQLGGMWGVNNAALLPWRDRCLDLLASFGLPWHVRWIPRALNGECDAMTKTRNSGGGQ